MANISDRLAPDLIFRNGRVRTMIDRDDLAQSIAIKGEWIIAVGSDEEVLELEGPRTRVVDLAGCTMTPGFIDPHVHLENANRYDRSLDASTSQADLVCRLGDGLQGRNGEWVIFYGRITDPSIWPSLRQLDELCASRPMVVSLGGAVHALNGMAMKRLSPDAVTRHGVSIEVDESGTPTGIIRTVGADGLRKVLPDAGIGDRASVKWGIMRGLSELSAAGVTTAAHMIRSLDPIEIYQELRAQDALSVRIGLILRGYESDISLKSILELGLRQGFGDDWVKMQGVKVSIDGYFPDGGAMFSEPYADEPDCCGHLRITPEQATEFVVAANRAGFRSAVHANGDYAVSLALDAYEQALRDTPRADHRHRIEHVGNLYLTDDHIKRLRDTGVVAVPNPPFFHARAHLMERRLGTERSRRPVAVRSLMAGGAKVAVASDFSGLYPVSPLIGMSGLVTRQTVRGDVFGVEEAIDAWTALWLYTVQAAWLNFEENRKGTIEDGKLADLVVLSDDPATVPPNKIADCEVVATFAGGRCSYASNSFEGFEMARV